jgi:hypothetical protein
LTCTRAGSNTTTCHLIPSDDDDIDNDCDDDYDGCDDYDDNDDVIRVSASKRINLYIGW